MIIKFIPNAEEPYYIEINTDTREVYFSKDDLMTELEIGYTFTHPFYETRYFIVPGVKNEWVLYKYKPAAISSAYPS